MTDIAETTETQVDQTAPDAAPAEEKPAKAKKVVEERECKCRVFRLIDPKDAATEFDTECTQTTRSTFAQGHDARLVSFLVQGQLDGYTAVRIDGDEGARVQFENAGHAAASISEKLGAKADNALKNAADRETAKELAKAESAARREAKKAETAAKNAAKKAEKANAPKEVKAKVVEGSQTGDAKRGPSRPTEVVEGESEVTIKVGRTEIPALSNGTEVRWIDANGKEQRRPVDTVRILAPVEA